ncbi:hypothetical protein [Coxiella-like endosymbiont]|nr:hypothetical protein [Coxiella-like endosymbiont]
MSQGFLNTATNGAICIRLSSDDKMVIWAAYERRYFWQGSLQAIDEKS